MELNLIVGESTFKATMYENECVKDFVSLLPITLTLADYNRKERSSRLPKRLAIEENEDGVNILAGDISYYTPFRNLCIYYHDSGLSFCQVSLGKIEKSGIEAIRKMAGSGPMEVTFKSELSK